MEGAAFAQHQQQHQQLFAALYRAYAGFGGCGEGSALPSAVGVGLGASGSAVAAGSHVACSPSYPSASLAPTSQPSLYGPFAVLPSMYGPQYGGSHASSSLGFGMRAPAAPSSSPGPYAACRGAYAAQAFQGGHSAAQVMGLGLGSGGSAPSSAPAQQPFAPCRLGTSDGQHSIAGGLGWGAYGALCAGPPAQGFGVPPASAVMGPGLAAPSSSSTSLGCAGVAAGLGVDAGKGKGKGKLRPKTPEELFFDRSAGGHDGKGRLWVRRSRLRGGQLTAEGVEIGNLDEDKPAARGLVPPGAAVLEVLCNRQSVLGNPFDMKKREDLRDAVLDAYADFLQAVATGASRVDIEGLAQKRGMPRDHCGRDWRVLYDAGGGACGVRAALAELRALIGGHKRRGERLRLICHCAPRRCHTSILAAHLDALGSPEAAPDCAQAQPRADLDADGSSGGRQKRAQQACGT